ncbi:MAG: epoxyqueuosine reductase [Deltaproteobacteria bacterium]|nr:epoxyqueuosine reductase [Deltaproteobacteria bacterium]
MNRQLTREAKKVALAEGAALVGVVRVADLEEHAESIFRILPSAKTVMVVASKHSVTALRSATVQVMQFDTIHTYGEVARVAHKTARFLEAQGFASAAVPAFLPIDMQAPKKGMRGEICWRRAAVRAGLGSYGENGLLVTKEYGAAVRLSGLVTAASLDPDASLSEDVCDRCMRCVDACPPKALSGEGKINKKLCGDHIFQYGFRKFQEFMKALIEEPKEEALRIIDGYDLRELWQSFMTGNYYYCCECQTKCPATDLPPEDAR